jgi:RNA polymerase-binding protein DksA
MVLTPDQLAQLRRVLEQRWSALLEQVRTELERSGDEHYIDLAGRVTDPGDESVADLLADVGAAIIDRQVRELRDIEAARARMAAQTYGICIDCRTEIGFERLMAYPTAKRCIECQGKHEKSFAQEGRPRL